MSIQEYRLALEEQYQGEVTGEASICQLLKQFTSPRQRYLLGSMLQLETETKARLRPVAAKLGISLIESDDARAAGKGFADLVKGLDWEAANKALEGPISEFVQRYRKIAEEAPAEFKDLADSMVIHEESLLSLIRSEASGQPDGSIDALVEQLVFPLPVLEELAE